MPWPGSKNPLLCPQRPHRPWIKSNMSCKNMKCKLLLAFGVLVFPVLAIAQTNDAVEVNGSVAEPSLQGFLMITADSISFYYLPDANLKKLEARLRYRDTP